MQQPGWYLKRLRRMSGAEVAYRLGAASSVRLRAVHLERRCPRATNTRTRPALPAAVRRVVAGNAGRRRRTRSRGPVQLLRSRGLRARRSAAVEPRSAHAPRRRDAPRRDASTTATNAWSATSSISGSRTGTCICRCWRRRIRSPATRVTRLASARRSIPGSSRCPAGRGANWVQRARARHPPHQLEHHLAAAGRRTRAPVRERRRRGVPRTLAATPCTHRRA